MNKLNLKAFSLACGTLWAAYIFFMGLTAMVCSWASPFVDFMGIMYRGYSASIIGCLIGTVWAFVDGAICGFLFAWLYNKLLK